MGSAATLPCLLLCIFYLAAGASAKPRYMVLIPSTFYYPYTGKVHIHLMDLDEPVRVTLHLASSHDVPNVTLEVQGSDILQLNWPRFSNISPPSEQNYAYWDLHISIEGGSLQVSEQKQVLVKFLAPGTLVQTDKDVYRPGQTVKIRIVRLDPNLAPSNREIPLVAVKDPSWNSVAEWEEVTPQQGIVDLSFSLPADTDLGTYTIVVEEKRHSFSVQGYGMRRFKVLIQLPNIVTVKDEKIPLDVCGRYPSGKPFRGKAKGKMCQFHRWDGTKICAEFRGQTGKNGCFSTEVPAASFNLTNFNYENWLTAKALLIEKGSGMRHAATKKCMVMYETVAITFENNDKFYKPGIPYTGMMLLKGTNGSVLKETELLLVVKAGGEKKNKTLVTDGLGRAFFELDTSGWNDEIVMRGELKDDSAASEQEDDKYPEYQTVIRYLYPFSVDSKSFMKIRRLKNKLPCDQPQKFWVDYSLDEKELGFKLQSLDMVFLVLAKGTIVTVLRKELPAEAGLRGSFSLELPIGLKLAPAAKVLGYVLLPSGEMVADSTELKVDKCFPSKVNLSFSEQRALVGSQLLLKVQAAPGALCAVYAMDEHGPKGTISPDTVYEFIPTPSEARYYSEEYDLPPSGTGLSGIILQLPAVNCFDVPGNSWRNCRRRLWRREVPAPEPQPSTYNLLEDAGLKAVTNAQLGCKVYMQFDEDDSFLYSPERKLRDERDIGMQTDFLGTWLWELVPVGEGGSAELTVTVPDAITKWEAGMFCMSPQGLGLAPATTLTAFKPFFVELALPYTVVRHEAFTLMATVFNYLRQCLQVRVTLVESMELEVLAGTDQGPHTGCVCADEERTFQWNVRATSLGKMNITVTAEALSSDELCSTQMPTVSAQEHVDTETKLLMVQAPQVM
ncbi:alpha-2-macroglobulin-like protein 1 [Columba livia]|uniref:alpha-2-macroglobulin-like protein 1 n=1 Tax=Columba livia TaxID=8932 RepID=UPI0031BAFEF0